MDIDKKQYPSVSAYLIEGEVKVKKEVDINQVYRDLGDFYKNNPDKRAELGPLLIELAEKMGIRIKFKDDRDMFLIADGQGRLVDSASGFRLTDKMKAEHPEYKVYNRTHPGCPPELKAEFDKKTGWA